MKKVVPSTGEVKEVKIHSWREPHNSKDFALDAKPELITNYDFSYNPETRQLEIVEVGKEDREAYIQSFKDECGVYNILAKFSLTGDVSLLNQRAPMYGDFSGLPTDDLNPDLASELAKRQLAQLNEKYGLSLTEEDAKNMTPEMLDKLLGETIAKLTPKKEEETKKDGE